MKILIVNRSSDLGGGNTISSSLAIGLDENIFKVFSFFPQTGPAISMLDKTDSVTILTPQRSNVFFIVFFLFKFLRKNNIDIVHAQGTRAAFWAKLAFLFLRRRPKFVYTLHGLHIVHRPFYKRYPFLMLEKALNFLVHTLVCPSVSVQSAVQKHKIITKSKTVLIYNGIDIDKFATVAPLDKKTLGIDENCLIISAIQTLDFPKDVSTILRAQKIVKSHNKNVMLLIIGSGPLKGKLQNMAKKLKIKNSVLFLGDRTDVERILGISDIVILSSIYEAMGLCLVEAMAAKKPVVGTNVEGINEIVENGKNGFLVELGNSKEMAKSLLLLLNNQKLRKSMGEAGFEFIQDRFSKDVMIKAYQDLYKNCL